eukprot:m.104840 g.104840  ORF g.104840 m.104840 type:complete len:67 (+) comp13264_c1_seq1:1035-1235(+)
MLHWTRTNSTSSNRSPPSVVLITFCGQKVDAVRINCNNCLHKPPCHRLNLPLVILSFITMVFAHFV